MKNRKSNNILPFLFLIVGIINFNCLFYERENSNIAMDESIIKLKKIFGSEIKTFDSKCYEEYKPGSRLSSWSYSEEYQDTLEYKNNWMRYYVCRFSDNETIVFLFHIAKPISYQRQHIKQPHYLKNESLNMEFIAYYPIENCSVWFRPLGSRNSAEGEIAPAYKWTKARLTSYNNFYHHIAAMLIESGYCKN